MLGFTKLLGFHETPGVSLQEGLLPALHPEAFGVQPRPARASPSRGPWSDLRHSSGHTHAAKSQTYGFWMATGGLLKTVAKGNFIHGSKPFKVGVKTQICSEAGSGRIHIGGIYSELSASQNN